VEDGEAEGRMQEEEKAKGCELHGEDE